MKAIAGLGGVIGPLPRPNQGWGTHQKSSQEVKSILSLELSVMMVDVQDCKILSCCKNSTYTRVESFPKFLGFTSKNLSYVIPMPHAKRLSLSVPEKDPPIEVLWKISGDFLCVSSSLLLIFWAWQRRMWLSRPVFSNSPCHFWFATQVSLVWPEYGGCGRAKHRQSTRTRRLMHHLWGQCELTSSVEYIHDSRLFFPLWAAAKQLKTIKDNKAE